MSRKTCRTSDHHSRKTRVVSGRLRWMKATLATQPNIWLKEISRSVNIYDLLEEVVPHILWTTSIDASKDGLGRKLPRPPNIQRFSRTVVWRADVRRMLHVRSYVSTRRILHVRNYVSNLRPGSIGYVKQHHRVKVHDSNFEPSSCPFL